MRTLRQLLVAICIALLALLPASITQANQLTAKQPAAEQTPSTPLETLLDKAADLVVLRRNVEAQQLYKQALQIDPTSSQAHAGLGWTLYDTGHYKQGLGEEHSALAIDYNNALAHHYLACMYLAKGRNQEAADEYRMEYKIDPKRRCHCGPIENVLKKYPSKKVN
jgi:Tfp pilus assembly protein PilF